MICTFAQTEILQPILLYTRYWTKLPNYPDRGRFKPSCANFKINGNNHVIVAGGANVMINDEGTQRIVEVSTVALSISSTKANICNITVEIQITISTTSM